MSSERLMILNMVSDGKLTVDEATLLLESIARLEVNDLTPSEENPPTTEPLAKPEPINDTNPEPIIPTDQASDSIGEPTPAKRNIWESVKHYIRRFRQPHLS